MEIMRIENPRACLTCKTTLEVAFSLKTAGPAVPKTGDRMLCTHCGECLQFDDALNFILGDINKMSPTALEEFSKASHVIRRAIEVTKSGRHV